MSIKSTNLDLDILGQSDPADLITVSSNFQKIDAVAGDIATVETSPTTAAHAKGEFIIFEGRLYKVTAAIASGAALVLGTNVSAANVGSEIKALQDSVSPKHLSLTYTAGTGVTVRFVDAYRIGKIVCLRLQVDVPVMANGDTIIAFSETLPAPVIYTHVFMANGNTGCGTQLNSSRTLVSGGANSSAKSWLSGTFVYVTSD